jgi:hypothetical protein
VSPTANAENAGEDAPFNPPGKKLEVLPIGLGVFAGVSVIALLVVGIVTYERTKHRKVSPVVFFLLTVVTESDAALTLHRTLECVDNRKSITKWGTVRCRAYFTASEQFRESLGPRRGHGFDFLTIPMVSSRSQLHLVFYCCLFAASVSRKM